MYRGESPLKACATQQIKDLSSKKGTLNLSKKEHSTLTQLHVILLFFTGFTLLYLKQLNFMQKTNFQERIVFLLFKIPT